MTEGVSPITGNDNSKSAPIPAGYIERPHQLPNVIIKYGKRPTVTDDEKKKKKPGVFGFFKAAVFVLRHRSKGKRKTAEVAAASDWKKLVSSMRPLHLQDNIKQSPLPVESLNLQTTYNCPSSPSVLSSGTMSQYASANDLQALDVPADHDTMNQYASATDLQALDHQPASTSSSSGTMSQYASANNLHELDDEEEEEDPDQVFDAIGADEMIDAKAEEFILQFYQQMRRQNIDSMSGQFN